MKRNTFETQDIALATVITVATQCPPMYRVQSGCIFFVFYISNQLRQVEQNFYHSSFIEFSYWFKRLEEEKALRLYQV